MRRAYLLMPQSSFLPSWANMQGDVKCFGVMAGMIMRPAALCHKIVYLGYQYMFKSAESLNDTRIYGRSLQSQNSCTT